MHEGKVKNWGSVNTTVVFMLAVFLYICIYGLYTYILNAFYCECKLNWKSVVIEMCWYLMNKIKFWHILDDHSHVEYKETKHLIIVKGK